MSSAGRKLSFRSTAGAGAIAVLVAASRIFARPRTFWGWDDYIFGLSLHLFAPQSWVPQPPFFPSFVYAARLANRLLRDDVAALTWVSVVSAAAGAGFVLGIARELGDETRTAVSAAVLFAFFPATWFFAGTPLSDTAGVTAALGAIWLALRSRRDSRYLMPAAAILGLAIGVRPQTAFVAFLPFALAVKRNPRRFPQALGVLALAIGAFWAAPVLIAAGGARPVARSLFGQWRYTIGVSSPLAHSTSAFRVLRRWLIDPWGSPYYAIAAWAAVAAGVAARAKGRNRDFFLFAGAGAALYGLCGILFLDLATTGRYALPVMPAAAIAAATGLAAIEDRGRISRGALSAGFVAASAVVVGPAIFILHTRPSPPVEAAARIQAEAGPGRYAIVYPAEYYVPAELLFPGVRKLPAEKTSAAELAGSPIPVWRFGVPAFETEEAAWPALRPFLSLGPGQYVRVPYGRWRPEPEFGAGWYGEERDGAETFRWMGNTGEILLPPCASPARLEFTLVAPLEALGGAPQVEVNFNGVVLDRRTFDARRTELSYRIDAGVDAASKNRLLLTTTRVFNPRRAGKGSDDRDLGLEIRRLRWGPAPSKVPRRVS